MAPSPPPSGGTSPSNSSPPPSSSSSPTPPPPPPPPPGSSPPPPSPSSSSPPPPSSSFSSPPPPDDSNSSPPPPDKPDSSPPPPPPKSSGRSPPPPPNDNGGSYSQYSPPPPPPPPHRSSSHHGRHPTSSSSSNGSSSSISGKTKLIVGVAIGAGLLLVVAILILCSCRKKRRKPPDDTMNYYRDNESERSRDEYYTPQHYQQPLQHVVKMPSPAWAAGSPNQPVRPPPPPPPSSGEISSSEFSRPHGPPMPPPPPTVALGFTKSTFTYEELAAATEDFSQPNLLGQGGYGYVHKGVLPNGKEVAVKSLKVGGGQGDREYQAEVEIISRVHHRHLVSLVGYCISEGQRILVYEFLPNNTLEYHLHGRGKESPILDWPTRLQIALGSAKGLAYLHEDCHPRIIHRDIKAANILLDFNYEAKVSDFGLAKLSSEGYTHVSTRVMGTFGYLAPEYAASGKLTEKSDTFSFGVMLLELITGRRPIDINLEDYSDDDNLVDWARPVIAAAMEDGDYSGLVDPQLGEGYAPQEMARVVACAGACIRHSPRRRPKMGQVVRALEGDVSLDDLSEWARPTMGSVFGGEPVPGCPEERGREERHLQEDGSQQLGIHKHGQRTQHQNESHRSA